MRRSAFSNQWQPLVSITGNLADFLERYEEASRENVIQFLALDPREPELHRLLLRAGAREREVGPRSDLHRDWEQLNRFYLLVTSPNAARRVPRQPGHVLRAT